MIKCVTSAVSAATTMVVGKKGSENVCICGDFSVTYNAYANVEMYPMPEIEDMHSALRGALCLVCWILNKHITRYPLPRGHKEISPLTHIGLFTFKRLPNGIHSGTPIFQRIMCNLLSDVPKAVSRLDDILVAGIDEEDHIYTLSLVLEWLLVAGFILTKAKCKFLQKCVTYRGHKIDVEVLHPIELAAIRDAPRPKDVTALKSFLGLIMFIHGSCHILIYYTCTSTQPVKEGYSMEVVQSRRRCICCCKGADTEFTNTGAL